MGARRESTGDVASSDVTRPKAEQRKRQERWLLDLSPSDPARSIFDIALEEVVRRGHDAVREEHILLGILGLSAGAASAAMDAVSTNRSTVRHRLEVTLPPNTTRERQGEYPYHPSGVGVLEMAVAEALASDASRLTSTHVLLGALEARGTAFQALEDSGVPIPALVRELRARAADLE
jgi:ATP-dependent Clp protease ATP-binding subunit ClpA